MRLAAAQKQVRAWLRQDLIWFMWIAIPCTLLSVATGGLEVGAERRADCDALVRYVVTLINDCVRYGIYFEIENPEFSRFWRIPAVRAALRRAKTSLRPSIFELLMVREVRSFLFAPLPAAASA